MAKSRVLVADDEPLTRHAVAASLARDHEIREVEDAHEAWEALREEVYHLLITDICMPGGGVDLVRRVRAALPDLPVIAMSGREVVREFRELADLGVTDCLGKPFSPSEIRVAARRALRLHELRQEASGLRRVVGWDEQRTPLLGESAPMRLVKEQLQRVACSDTSVLVVGETGTGKELVARSLHEASLRADGPFIAVNTGALSDELIESSLFGHAQGAFTGATQARPGCFETAHGGTLFLDEVGTMSPALQVRLLRVLSVGEVHRLGETRARPVSSRLVAATNADLEREVAEGRFRQDLYHRLAVFPIRLPSLASRGADDLALLSDHLVAKCCRRLGRASKELDESARELLLAHSWPGNVRELENALERAILLAGASERIRAEHVLLRPARRVEGPDLELPEEGLDLRAVLEQAETALLRQAIDRTGGNRAAAGRLLGLPATTMADRLRAKGLDPT